MSRRTAKDPLNSGERVLDLSQIFPVIREVVWLSMAFENYDYVVCLVISEVK